MMRQRKLIEIRDLSVQFGSHSVLRDLDLDVYQGEILAVVGLSGSGKSVLMRAVLGLLRGMSGSVRFLDQGEDADQKACKNTPLWSMLFQDGALFSSLTVRQNVQVPMHACPDMPRWMMDEIAAVKIGLSGLPQGAADLYPAELSGGMRKRAALARAIALDPKILFLDEPTAGLDPIAATALDQVIAKMKNNLGLTVFLVTHDLDSLYTICDRVAMLGEGRILAVGTLEEVRASADPMVRAYFGGSRALRRTGSAALTANL